ncbi:hypothetical protein [Coralliovum pocilloporae]|uniref:hypothetical protein n=1 Tax=Coralliovum pocilloporae TaxID=3066369 RepID=UPI003306F9B3
MQTALSHFHTSSRKPGSPEQVEAMRRKWFIASKEQRQKREEMEERAEDTFIDLAIAATIATEAQIEAFNRKLDTYDEATVRALMENQEALDAVQAEIDDMLSRAHKLEDGRRVFKTEDGRRVFDEHGNELDQLVVDPESISDQAPTWESFDASVSTLGELKIERQEIFQYQEKLDAVREHASSGEITEDELAELEADLDGRMPPAVQRQLPDYEPTQETSLTSDFMATARDVAISTVAPAQAPVTPGLGQ